MLFTSQSKCILGACTLFQYSNVIYFLLTHLLLLACRHQRLIWSGSGPFIWFECCANSLQLRHCHDQSMAVPETSTASFSVFTLWDGTSLIISIIHERWLLSWAKLLANWHITCSDCSSSTLSLSLILIIHLPSYSQLCSTRRYLFIDDIWIL